MEKEESKESHCSQIERRICAGISVAQVPHNE